MSSTADDVLRELQARMSLAMILEKQRATAVENQVREQFEGELRGLTEAEQDTKELKSAKRHLLFDRIAEAVRLPFPGGGDEGEHDSLTKGYIRKACESIYKSLVRQKIAVDKRRPDGRTETQIRPIEVEVSVSPRTHGSGALHPRPDADHDAAHARHGQGRPADRRPLARDRPPLHAPLQLPALLGRGDGPHGLAEAA